MAVSLASTWMCTKAVKSEIMYRVDLPLENIQSALEDDLENVTMKYAKLASFSCFFRFP